MEELDIGAVKNDLKRLLTDSQEFGQQTMETMGLYSSDLLGTVLAHTDYPMVGEAVMELDSDSTQREVGRIILILTRPVLFLVKSRKSMVLVYLGVI